MELERIRAEERLTQRHSNSRKGKFVFKDSGNEEGREAILEKMRKREELLRKISGKDSDDDNSLDEDEEMQLMKKEISESKDSSEHSKGIMGMKFMQRALEAKKNAILNDLDEELTGREKYMARR